MKGKMEQRERQNETKTQIGLNFSTKAQKADYHFMRNTDESCCLDLENYNFTGMGLEIALKTNLTEPR